ncbi:MAG: hypothetical protein IPI55_13135 [Flavobacteriales bacterium]|nr:hypothetical protein [Flavobacteriales bacterium]
MHREPTGHGHQNPDGPPAERVALYDKLVVLFRGGTQRQSDALNLRERGNMFSFLDRERQYGTALTAKARERFMEKHGTGLFMTHGAVVKECDRA